ncbi:hypothetical protein IWW39_003392 [Coemansia spiralis]|uniref:Uncharacterized protein n=1 Tax=Coemansia spiralis TaxID=417178 RepID=A0A9W8GL93_9FUNG|nr:hypothetical protein IWW39_003392 [Coemansia spiralis]
MNTSTVSAEYTDAVDASTAFGMTENASGGNLADILERMQGQLNARLTAMMAAEKNNQESETPLSSAEEDSDSANN